MKNLLSNAMFLVVPLVMLIGVAVGVGLRPTFDQLVGARQSVHDDHEEDQAGTADPHPEDCPYDSHAAHAEEEDHEEDHIPLSKQAFNNLRLELNHVELSTYTRVVRMPGEVIDTPGLSCRKVAAPVSGRVVQLYAAPGETVFEGDLIAEVEIIDDDLMQAQLRLLELVTKAEIVHAELARLAPLTEAGGVAGRRRLEYEYQEKEVAGSLSRTRQELAMRGLSESQISQIIDSGATLKRLQVLAPAVDRDAPPTRLAQRVKLSTYEEFLDGPEELQVESLLAQVGQNLSRGDPICNLSAHALLMIRGNAFEKDVNLVTELTGSHQPITAEFGAVGKGRLVEGLHVQTVAGHADAGTQNFPFYVPLPNEVVGETTDETGRIFRLWRYKVGQRVHVLAPVEQIDQQIVLPRDAVVQETAEALVFRVLDEHGPDHLDDHDGHEEEEAYVELEPVPVSIVAQDAGQVVVAPGELLEVGDQLATNNAYQLYLAWQSQKEGGGGHEHHHH